MLTTAAAALWMFAAADISIAISAIEKGENAKAVEILSPIVRNNPKDPEANHYLALAYLRSGQAEAARPYAEAAAQLSATNPAVWKTLGSVMAGSSHPERALSAFEKACALAAQDTEACYYFGRTLHALGRYEEASAPLNQALQAASNELLSRVHRAAALNFVALGQPEDAERHFRLAVETYAGDRAPVDDPRSDYGGFLIRQGRAADALEPLQGAVKAAPESARANFELGKALLHLNKPETAAVHLEKAVAADPGNWNARLLLGKSYVQVGRREEGERQMRLAKEGWNNQGSSTVK